MKYNKITPQRFFSFLFSFFFINKPLWNWAVPDCRSYVSQIDIVSKSPILEKPCLSEVTTTTLKGHPYHNLGDFIDSWRLYFNHKGYIEAWNRTRLEFETWLASNKRANWVSLFRISDWNLNSQEGNKWKQVWDTLWLPVQILNYVKGYFSLAASIPLTKCVITNMWTQPQQLYNSFFFNDMLLTRKFDMIILSVSC